MMFRSRAAQTTILAAGSVLGFMAAAHVHAHAQGNLEATYTISFARIPVGEITATVVFGDSECDFCAGPCWWRHESTIGGRRRFLQHTRRHQGRSSRADKFHVQDRF